MLVFAICKAKKKKTKQNAITLDSGTDFAFIVGIVPTNGIAP